MRTCDGCGRDVAARSATLRILCLACHPGDLPMSEQEAETWPNPDEVNAGCDQAIAEARRKVDSAPTADGLIAAVLAVMPKDADGSVTIEYAKPWCGYDACIEHFDLDGPPEPLAAKYVAAVLSAAADELDPDHRNIEGIVRWMRARVDEIERGQADAEGR
jgi:hypothetical protein